ncbi:MAG: cobalt-precorrin-6A reductase [Pelagibacteraceae bacterium]|nr:cobalt-precorrin-6A reductase [Pelagibacteraceae bacterium]PPR10898.1 MAG: Precorrin-6A reductase [Alphaproteobacteria bacterium MarineAlpha11_Bin1]|tara:strand:+ start:7572 stop:8321 length:750 start_codon:yes stop_codon:yes gene_type:complete
MADRPRALLLGGTSEAVALARKTAENFDVTYSLAGRTRNPSRPDNVTIRTGGFGGVAALSAWLLARNIDLVVDATHPFAEQISLNAHNSCQITGIPLLRLLRPAWQAVSGDIWYHADDIADASRKIRALGTAAFLSVGHQELRAFAGIDDIRFLIRTVDPLETVPLLKSTYITGRGPFSVDQETALLQAHEIDVLVSKNAGGNGAYAKITAARNLGLSVLMIGRPSSLPGNTVDNIDRALDWMGMHRRR